MPSQFRLFIMGSPTDPTRIFFSHSQPAFIQGIHQCLEAILSPDTNQIKSATAELNTKYYTSAECIPALYEAAASSPNQGVSREIFRILDLRRHPTDLDPFVR